MTIIIITKMMWHPIGSQVACKVVFRPMPSGSVCKVSGDPLKALSNVACESFGVTCKHAYRAYPSPSPNPFPSAVQILLSMSFSV